MVGFLLRVRAFPAFFFFFSCLPFPVCMMCVFFFFFCVERPRSSSLSPFSLAGGVVVVVVVVTKSTMFGSPGGGSTGGGGSAQRGVSSSNTGNSPAPSAEALAAQLQATIANLSSGKCTQVYTASAQKWLREYQQTRNAWSVSFAFLRNPARCKSQTELFFHAQTLHEKTTQLGVGAENTFDAAGCLRLKKAILEVWPPQQNLATSMLIGVLLLCSHFSMC